MVAWNSLVLFLGAAIVIAAMPGPDIVYVLTRGIAQGTKAAVAAALGFATCILVHTSFAIAGLSALLQASTTGFMVIKFIGAGYLIYLGVKMLRDKRQFELQSEGKRLGIRQIYFQSLITGSLNPKLAIFFLAFLPQFVRAENGAAWMQLLELGLVSMMCTLVIFLITGIFAGKLGAYLRRNKRIAGGIRYAAGSILCLLGLGLAIHDH